MEYVDRSHLSFRASLRTTFLTLFIFLTLVSCSDDPSAPEAIVASITLDAPATFLAVGETLQLTATPRDENGDPVSADVLWSSSDASVATIDAGGTAHGVALGGFRAIATTGDRTASMDMTVRELGSLLSGRIARPVITLEPGLEYHAVGDLELVADSVLSIAGTLVVGDGISVNAGSLDSMFVTGSIVPADAGTSSARHTRSVRAAAAPTPDLTLWGSNLNIGRASGQSEITSKGGVNIGGINGPRGTGELIIEGATIQAGLGAPGTKQNPNGGPGGNVEIGTETARNAAAAASGRPSALFPYIGFQGSVIARAGGGGGGFMIGFRSDATIASNTVTAVAGNGGRGGNVRVEAGDVSFKNSTLVGLFGGKGGDGGWVAFNAPPDVIHDGSGPNGEGESLTGTTGSGNQGGDVSVVGNIFAGANSTIEAGRGGSPGNFLARGGDGRNGGGGGNFTARIGIRGSPGAAIVDGAAQPDPDPASRALVRVESSMSGSQSTNSAMPGGAGGKLEVTDLTGNGAAYVEPIDATESMNGGTGFNGCVVEPQTNGTNGGPGGTFQSFGVALGRSALSFLGGSGGSGVQPGTGGAEGRNLDTDTPLGERGPDGGLCPTTLLVSVNTTQIAFTHFVGITQCPQLVATVRVKNESGQQITVTPTVVDTNAILYSPVAAFALGPGEARDVTVTYDCTPPFLSFEAEFRFVARLGAEEQILGIPIIATIVP